MDFFAGSGTTAQGVMEQNAADGARRRFIAVQLPEPLNEQNKEDQAAIHFCDQLNKPRTISELTKERLRRAAAKLKRDSPMFSGDLGFRCFRLDRSNIAAWSPKFADLKSSLFDHAEHLVVGRTEADVLYELLLKLGLDLCVPTSVKTIAGKKVHSVAGGVLMACLESNISAQEVESIAQGISTWRKELAPAGDTTCVFRDSAFADDVAKTNMAAILEQNGIANVRSL